MVTWRYKIYLLVLKNISHSKINFLSMCDVLSSRSSLVGIFMTSFPNFSWLFVQTVSLSQKRITWCLEDMNHNYLFMLKTMFCSKIIFFTSQK